MQTIIFIIQSATTVTLLSFHFIHTFKYTPICTPSRAVRSSARTHSSLIGWGFVVVVHTNMKRDCRAMTAPRIRGWIVRSRPSWLDFCDKSETRRSCSREPSVKFEFSHSVFSTRFSRCRESLRVKLTDFLVKVLSQPIPGKVSRMNENGFIGAERAEPENPSQRYVEDFCFLQTVLPRRIWLPSVGRGGLKKSIKRGPSCVNFPWVYCV